MHILVDVFDDVVHMKLIDMKSYYHSLLTAVATISGRLQAQTHAYSALKKGLFCYKNLLSLVISAIKDNNINMVLSLSVMYLSVLRRFSTK